MNVDMKMALLATGLAFALGTAVPAAEDLEVHLYTLTEPGAPAQVLLPRSNLMALSAEGPAKPETAAIEPEANDPSRAVHVCDELL